jgi:hypothetical protein
MQTLARHEATRYIQPLREGGSLPAVVDTDGGGLFVVKFRAAGQGAKALIAELIVGQLAQTLDLPVPELAVIELSAAFGRSEPDPEIQNILRGSAGANVGLRYLDGAFNFDVAAAGALIAGDFATRLVWLDALVTNPDRSHRNPNLLVWRRTPGSSTPGARSMRSTTGRRWTRRARGRRSRASASTSCSTARATSPRWTRGWPPPSAPT